MIVKFGIFKYEWPYDLSMTKVEKIKKLYKKYDKRTKEIVKKYDLTTSIRCYKRRDNAYVPVSVCFSKCKTHCRRFDKEVYLCMSLNCPYSTTCFKKTKKKRDKICKKVNQLDERNKLRKIYGQYILLCKISRGFKIDPLQTIKFLKNRKEKDGKIQSKKSREKSKGERETKKKRIKKNSKKQKAS